MKAASGALSIATAGLILGAGLPSLARADDLQGARLTQAPAPGVPGEQPPPALPPGPQPQPVPEDDSPPSAPSAPAESVAPQPEPPAMGESLGSPAPPVEATAAAETSAEDAAALAALVGDLSGSDGAAALSLDEAVFSLYGFSDFTFVTPVGKESSIGSPYSTFYVGNLNVYLSTEFERNWRSLVEVRFMYLPHGAQAGSDSTLTSLAEERIDTSVYDSANFNTPIRWGGIAIQRAWLEYNFNQYLTLRGGQWLTPYGIWNVDHGSPTIIGVARPFIITQGWFPEQQTGIEAYGGFFIDDTKLGYHLTLSNGRGPIDAYHDLNHNKGVGGRLYVRNDALLGTWTLGVSGYRGVYTDRPVNAQVLVDGVLVIQDPPTTKYDELALSADLKWEWEGLLVQSEAILSDIRYPDALRPVSLGIGIPPSVTPDLRRYGAYVMVGYRTPWWGIMPYGLLQKYHNPLAAEANEYTFGLNMRPSPRVAFKAELKYVNLPAVTGVELKDLTIVALQAAWSF